MSNDYNTDSRFQQIQNLVSGGWSALKRRRKLAVLFAAMGTILLGFWLVLLLESWLWMSPVIRNTLLIATIIAGGVAGWRLIAGPGLKDYHQYYRELSRKHDLETVRNVLDLMETPADSRSGLHDKAIEQFLAGIDSDQVRSKVHQYSSNHPVTGQWKAWGLILGVSLILAGLTSVWQADAFQRLGSPGTVFYPPNPFVFQIAPGDTIIEQGSRIRFTAQFEGEVPGTVQLAMRTDVESDFRTQRLEPSGEQGFTSAPMEIFDDLNYYLIMDGFRSDSYALSVQLLPRFSELLVTVEPPDYTGLSDVRYEYPFSRVEAYPGSRLHISARTNQSLSRATVIRKNPADTLNLEYRDGRTGKTLDISGADSLWFNLEEPNGLKNRNTFAFTVEALTDDYPEVRLLRPEPEKSVLEPSTLDMIYEISDDFGFHSVRLGYRIQRSFRSGDPETGSISLPTPPRGENFAVDDFSWDLRSLNLLPMDVVSYWIEVRDNDSFAGFKSARSGEQRLRIASLTDHLLAQEEREDEVASRLQEFRESYEQNRREYEELRQRILGNEQDNWEQSRAAEDIRESREELSRQLDEIREQFEELSRDMDDTRQISDDTRQMYEDLQRLMEEIDDPKILEAMQKLQEGLENMDRDQIRQALQDIEFDEQRYQERLDRTIELFRSLQMNAELDRMNAMLEDLARQEESLIGDDLPSTEEQARQQERISQDLDQLRERLESLPDKSPRRNRDQVEQLSQSLDQQMQEISDKLQEDIQEMQDGGSGESSESQQRRQDIRDRLDDMSSTVSSARSMMGSQSISVNRRALLGIMQNLLLLSDTQENLVRETSGLTQGSAGFVEVARRQQVVSRSFGIITDSLYQVSAEIPRFPNMINDRKVIIQRHLDRAVGYLAERDRNRSVAEERTALGGINEIASLLADLIEQLDDQQGNGQGGGMSPEQMLEQLQKLSGEQAELNQQIQDMINDMAGERLMQDQMDRLDQMARQQNEIRRQLRQLQQSGGLNPGDDLLSELQRLSEQMEDAINDLRGGVTEERIVVQRQQNILSRMLEAERALNERDEDEERRGDIPDEVERVSPSELTLKALREQIRRRMQDGTETRFTDEYQQLIQKYFELLEEEQQRRERSR